MHVSKGRHLGTLETGERESRQRLRVLAEDALSRAAGARLVSSNRIRLLRTSAPVIRRGLNAISMAVVETH
jgi:hypothetical protein